MSVEVYLRIEGSKTEIREEEKKKKKKKKNYKN